MDSLGYWKRFFNVFGLGVTVTKAAEKKRTNNATNEDNSLKELKKDLELETASFQRQTEQCITESNEVFETPRFDLFDVVQSHSNIQSNTTECLKEFDEILNGISDDVETSEYVTLDEIDDVLSNLNEQDTIKGESSILEASNRLKDNIQSFDLCSENSQDTVVEIKNDIENNEPNDSDETNKPNSLDKNNKTDYYIDLKENVEETDIISISSEDSQNQDANLKPEENKDKPEKLKSTKIKDEKALTDVTDEVKAINDQDIKEFIFLDDSDDDCGYHSSDFEFITEEEAKKDGLIVNFNSNTKKTKVKKQKRTKTMKVAIHQVSISKRNKIEPCSNYKLKDSPELNKANSLELDKDQSGHNRIKSNVSEASNSTKLSNTRNFELKDNPELNKRNSSKIDNDNSCYNNVNANVREPSNSPGPSNTGKGSFPQHNVTRILRNVRKIKLNNLGPGINNLDSVLSNFRIPEIPKLDDKSVNRENAQRIYPAPKMVIYNNSIGPTIQINCTEISNSLQINYSAGSNMQGDPESNNFDRGLRIVQDERRNMNGPGDSFMSNVQGPVLNNIIPGSSIQGNCHSNITQNVDPTIKKWRTYQNRNQIRRQQFVLDQSYRVTHRMLEGEEYYRLFDPNYGPLPNNSMRFIENKSTMSNKMVEYHGIGFNMQILREAHENEEDGDKNEADDCTRRIFEMYPGDNRRKRRRF